MILQDVMLFYRSPNLVPCSFLRYHCEVTRVKAGVMVDSNKPRKLYVYGGFQRDVGRISVRTDSQPNDHETRKARGNCHAAENGTPHKDVEGSPFGKRKAL